MYIHIYPCNIHNRYNNNILLYVYGAAGARTQHSLTLMAQEWCLQRCRAPRSLFSSFYFPLSLQDGLPRKSLRELIYLLRRFAEHRSINILYRAARHNNTYIDGVCSQIGSRAFILLLLLFRCIYF